MSLPARKCRLLALAPIADDPRVRRMGDALAASGWEVTGIGLRGAKSKPPDWPIIMVADKATSANLMNSTSVAEGAGEIAATAPSAPEASSLRLDGSAVAYPLREVRRRTADAEGALSDSTRSIAGRLARRAREQTLPEADRRRAQYWRLSPALIAMKQIATNLQGASLWIANDWWMLPIAAAGQQASGGAIAYDSHELAIEEFSENRLWRKFQRPIVAAIESEFIGRAEVVTSVSPGITEFLRTSYKLTAPTFTLRNSPRYRELAFRPTPSKIKILYQGLVRPGRGLEAAIRSVPLWRPEFELTIRGPAETRYLAELKKLASAGGANARIEFEPAVPMTELVAYAAASDVGLMALPDMSLHTRSALPNKLFEYMMAGLALIVTDLPEMATLVRTTGSGRTISDLSPASIAATINGLDRDRIDTMKRASLRAAKQYNWETESAPVLEAYAALARAGGA